MATLTLTNRKPQLFTCLACQIAFYSAELQRDHYATDWHRYNLKRKVAELPPITSEVFAQKLIDQQAQSQSDAEKASFRAECYVCSKTYYSENAYANHLQSNKHKLAEAKGINQVKKYALNNNRSETASSKPAPRATENKSSDEIAEISADMEEMSVIDKKIANAVKLEEEDCLFCAEKSASFDENMEHMTKVHSLFIPEIEYLTDLRGLIKYLGEKITVGNICLYCNGRGKSWKSLEAVRKHMLDKGHCSIAYDRDEDIMEISDYYDFTSSYSDDHSNVYVDNSELVLPSGARIGHRSLRLYYKQNLRPREERDSVIINRLLTHYTDNFGYQHNSGGIMIVRDETTRMSRVERFADQKSRAEFTARIGIKGNRLQKHYRPQIL